MTLLVEALRATTGLSDQSERRLLEVICRFLRFLDGSGIDSLSTVSPAVVGEFVHARSTATGAEPSVATSHLRRSAVRLLFRVLREVGVVDHDPTLDLVLPARSSLRARPLTDDEIALGRSFSLETLGRDASPGRVGAGRSDGADVGALRRSVSRDLDLEAGRVWHPRGARRPSRGWGRLTDWGVRALERRIDVIGRDAGHPAGLRGRWLG